MAPPLKSQYWQQLKTAQEMGVPIEFTKAYVSYTEKELKELIDRYLGDTYEEIEEDSEPAPVLEEFILPEAGEFVSLEDYERLEQATQRVLADTPEVREVAAPEVREVAAPEVREVAAPAPEVAASAPFTPVPASAPTVPPPVSEWGRYAPETLASLLGVPYSDEAARRAGLTFNTHGPDDVLRVDSQGRVWYKDEVPKPAIPLPRMRRKVRTLTSNVETKSTFYPDGRLNETFEVAGQEQHEMEVKVTLPSSQVGVYYDPRLPFRVHVYNGRRGFDRMDVLRFYGGLDLVPSTVATLYVGDDLCYDINKTRDTMERELREKQLLGRNSL